METKDCFFFFLIQSSAPQFCYVVLGAGVLMGYQACAPDASEQDFVVTHSSRQFLWQKTWMTVALDSSAFRESWISLWLRSSLASIILCILLHLDNCILVGGQLLILPLKKDSTSASIFWNQKKRNLSMHFWTVLSFTWLENLSWYWWRILSSHNRILNPVDRNSYLAPEMDFLALKKKKKTTRTPQLGLNVE